MPWLPGGQSQRPLESSAVGRGSLAEVGGQEAQEQTSAP